MDNVNYRYTDKQIKEAMKGFTIVSDSREQSNAEILSYFSRKNVPYVIKAQKTGDYGCYIKANPELGIMVDLNIPARIERKNGPDELAGNLQSSTEVRFKNELHRSKDIPFTIVVEGKDSYYDLIMGNYRSKYKPESLLARLNSLKAAYNFEIVYLEKELIGHYIHHHLKAQAMHYLKNMPIQIYIPKENPTAI